MPQPVRKSGTYQKPRSKTVKKRIKPTEVDKRLPSKPKVKRQYVRQHPKYGTSKLEERFAKEFLDKLGVEYVYQFEAKSIGRFFDFYLPKEHILIEVDGDYYHSYGLLYEQMSPMQKRNKRVDELKDHWALINGIPLLRIWEHDINKHPSEVMNLLISKFSCARDLREKIENKNKRH